AQVVAGGDEEDVRAGARGEGHGHPLVHLVTRHVERGDLPLVLAVPAIDGGLEPLGLGDEVRVLLWGRAVEVPERQRRLGGGRRAARAQQGDARGDGATGQDGTA